MNYKICSGIAAILLSACTALSTEMTEQQQVHTTESVEFRHQLLGRAICNPDQFSECVAAIIRRVREHMDYAGLDEVPLNAQAKAYVLLAPDGQVMQAKVVESSGYPDFDRAVETAIEHSTPLPALPDPAKRRFNITFQKGVGNDNASTASSKEAPVASITAQRTPQVQLFALRVADRQVICRMPAPVLTTEAPLNGVRLVKVTLASDGKAAEVSVVHPYGDPVDGAIIASARETPCDASGIRSSYLLQFRVPGSTVDSVSTSASTLNNRPSVDVPRPRSPTHRTEAELQAAYERTMELAAFRRKCGMLPKLFYPSLSIKANEHGTVVVRILIGLNGDVDQTEIVQSSGYPRLDQAVIDGVKYLKCVPQVIDGKISRVFWRIPVAFDLGK